MLIRPRVNWICAQCLSRRALSTTTRKALQEQGHAVTAPAPPPPASGYARLTNRKLIAVHGPDSARFLQGLTTQDLPPDRPIGVYSAFLTATGRVLNDVFIYSANASAAFRDSLPSSKSPDDPAYFIEADAEQVKSLHGLLRRYKLRAKLDTRILDNDEWGVWSAWRAEEPWTAHPSSARDSNTTSTTRDRPSAQPLSYIGCADLRAPGMGHRLILPHTSSPLDALASIAPSTEPNSALSETTLQAYHIRRILRGVAEGQVEIRRETALPLESNIDLMAGINFRKGCYIGQELTIRTHHTGVIRKRILPVMLYPADTSGSSTPPTRLEYSPAATPDTLNAIAEDIADGTDITAAGQKTARSPGKWLAGVGNIGLALCRVEVMTDMVLTPAGSRYEASDEFKMVWGGEEGREMRVKAFVPDWIRNQTKVKNPQRRVQ